MADLSNSKENTAILGFGFPIPFIFLILTYPNGEGL